MLQLWLAVRMLHHNLNPKEMTQIRIGDLFLAFVPMMCIMSSQVFIAEKALVDIQPQICNVYCM